MLKSKLSIGICGLASALLLITTALLVSMNAGAAGVTITVNSVTYYKNDLTNDFSYFEIDITTAIDEVPSGEYPGWCADMDNGIGSSWPAQATMWNYADPTLPSPHNTFEWDRVCWLVNEKDAPTDYEIPIIQMAIWGILGWDYEDSHYAPVSVADQGFVDGLITAAASHDGYLPSQEGDVWLYIIHVSDKVQRTVIEVPFEEEENDGKDDTCWAYGSADTELWDLEVKKGKKTKPLTNKWGWFFMYEEGEGTAAAPIEKTLYAGAGQNDLSKGWIAGTAEIWNVGDTLYVRYVMDDDTYLSEAHVYAGEDAPETAAPGQFPYNSGDITFEDDYSFTIGDLGSWDELYVAVHGVAWYFE